MSDERDHTAPAAEQLATKALQDDIPTTEQTKIKPLHETTPRVDQPEIKPPQDDVANVEQPDAKLSQAEIAKVEQPESQSLQDDVAKAERPDSKSQADDMTKAKQLDITSPQNDLVKAEQPDTKASEDDATKVEQPENGEVLDKVAAQAKVRELTAQATALYAVKRYEEAAELYSEATQLQADIRGEMSEENADLLYSYGKCLFLVAQKTSTVLGGPAATAQLKGSEQKPSKKRKRNGAFKDESANVQASASASASASKSKISAPTAKAKPEARTDTKSETVLALDPGREPQSTSHTQKKAETSQSATQNQEIVKTTRPADTVPVKDVEAATPKPSNALFKIEGDAADWADSDDEEGEEDEGSDGEEEEEQEDDDFATAFEILDIARIIYQRKLKHAVRDHQTPENIRHLRIRVADIYDLQAEISLEGEKFSVAVTDLRSCLELKAALYEPDNSIVAECHYKLSLALEAAAQEQKRDEAGNPVGEIVIDWNLRRQACFHQEMAIKSCRARVDREQEEFGDIPDDKKARARDQIEDVQDMINAMDQRWEELKRPPMSVRHEAEKEAQQALMGTVLGSLLGGTADEQKGKLAQIVAGANDLTGMVKKKKKPAAVDGSVRSIESRAKRPATLAKPKETTSGKTTERVAKDVVTPAELNETAPSKPTQVDANYQAGNRGTVKSEEVNTNGKRNLDDPAPPEIVKKVRIADMMN